MRSVAVILARGPVAGPLLTQTLAAAKASTRVSSIWVMADEAAAARSARAVGASVIDPPSAAGDASAESLLLYALEMIEAEGEPVDAIALLGEGAAPVASEIDACLAAVSAEGSVCAFTAAPVDGYFWTSAENGEPLGLNHDPAAPRRGEARTNFRETGAVYAMGATAFRATGSRFCGRVVLVPPAADGPVPPGLKALVMDFDGVFTDDRVLVDQDGKEAVFASRSDGMGLGRLRAMTDLKLLILSKEPNPVVSARGRKLKIEVIQGIDDKLPELDRWLAREGIARAEAAYVGNDVNDLECMDAVGFPVAPGDARPEAIAIARYVTKAPGGRGALRELCEMLIGALRG